MKKLIVFDFDGTIIDSQLDVSTAIVYAANSVCPELPEGSITLEHAAPLLGKTLHETFAALLPSQYHDRINDCVVAYRNYYLENCTRNTYVYDGVIELLTNLHQQGKKLAIATTKVQPTVDTVCGKLGLTPYFDLVQGVNNFPSKPNPYILNLVMQKFEVTPDETIMIGDTDNDVLCGQAAGVEVCAVTWGAWSKAMVMKLEPDYIVDTIAELSTLLLDSVD